LFVTAQPAWGCLVLARELGVTTLLVVILVVFVDPLSVPTTSFLVAHSDFALRLGVLAVVLVPTVAVVLFLAVTILANSLLLTWVSAGLADSTVFLVVSFLRALLALSVTLCRVLARVRRWAAFVALALEVVVRAILALAGTESILLAKVSSFSALLTSFFHLVVRACFTLSVTLGIFLTLFVSLVANFSIVFCVVVRALEAVTVALSVFLTRLVTLSANLSSVLLLSLLWAVLVVAVAVLVFFAQLLCLSAFLVFVLRLVVRAMNTLSVTFGVFLANLVCLLADCSFVFSFSVFWAVLVVTITVLVFLTELLGFSAFLVASFCFVVRALQAPSVALSILLTGFVSFSANFTLVLLRSLLRTPLVVTIAVLVLFAKICGFSALLVTSFDFVVVRALKALTVAFSILLTRLVGFSANFALILLLSFLRAPLVVAVAVLIFFAEVCGLSALLAVIPNILVRVFAAVTRAHSVFFARLVLASSVTHVSFRLVSALLVTAALSRWLALLSLVPIDLAITALVLLVVVISRLSFLS